MQFCEYTYRPNNSDNFSTQHSSRLFTCEVRREILCCDLKFMLHIVKGHGRLHTQKQGWYQPRNWLSERVYPALVESFTSHLNPILTIGLRLVMAIRLGGCLSSAHSDLEAHHLQKICSRWQSEATCHCLAAVTRHRLHKSRDMKHGVKCLNANRGPVEVWCVPSAAIRLLPYILKYLGIIHVNFGLYSWNAHILGAG